MKGDFRIKLKKRFYVSSLTLPACKDLSHRIEKQNCTREVLGKALIKWKLVSPFNKNETLELTWLFWRISYQKEGKWWNNCYSTIWRKSNQKVENRNFSARKKCERAVKGCLCRGLFCFLLSFEDDTTHSIHDGVFYKSIRLRDTMSPTANSNINQK